MDAFYKCYRSISDNKSLVKYFDFKETLILNASSFSKRDRHLLYLNLQNSFYYLISPEINKSKEILDIIELKIRDEVMLDPNGLLPDADFVSHIQTACNLGDSDFIEDFSEKFIKFTPERFKENLQKFSSAHLYFLKNKFDKSLDEILTMNYDILYFKYSLRNLRAMNYYELKDYNSFLLLLDSYKHFINKDLSGNERFKTKGKLLINEINNLFKLRENFNELALKNLKSQIVNTPTIIRRQWLLEKIDELEKSRKKSEPPTVT